MQSKQDHNLKINSEATVEDHKRLDSLLVFNIIAWAGRLLPSSTISKISSSAFPSLTPARVEVIIAELQARGAVNFDTAGWLTGIKDFYGDDLFDEISQAEIHTQYAENAIRYWQSPRSPRYFFHGFLSLPKSRFDEVRSRILLIRNWLITIESEYTNTPRAKLMDHLIFQLDLNLFPILDEAPDID